MNLSALFIRRPVATTLVIVGMMVFGAVSYGLLPVSDLPTIDYPTIQVQANLPGASPETMASSVALPLEKQFATISGLDSMGSTSSLGNTSITLQFALNRNIDAAAQDVQSMISRVGRQLPPQMPSPPSYQKVNPGDRPVMQLVLHSATQPISLVNEYAESMVAQRLASIDGVAQVQIFSNAKYAVRIDLDPRRLSAHGIGIDEAAAAVQSANVSLPTGTVYGADRTFTIQANGQLMRASQYASTIIAYRNGNPVRLDAVAHVYDGVENTRMATVFKGHPGIQVAILKQPGANVVAVVEAVKALLPSFVDQLPPSISLDIRSDRSKIIRESVADMKFTLMLAIGFAVLVIFLFLRNISATVIPSLALPVSLVTTFAMMYLVGYSIDNLSLLALMLSVAFIVDDTIVVLENIIRHMHMGKPPMQAAFDGSKEIAFTVLSMTVALVAVFIPVLFLGGLVGRLLREFAVTIAVAVLVSGFVSISLTPMLCSRFLTPPQRQHHGWFYRSTERVLDGWRHLYGRTLRLCLRYHVVVMVASVLLVVATGYLFQRIPKGFLAIEDTGRLNVVVEGPQGISFDAMKKHQQEVSDILEQSPSIAGFISSMGGQNVGQFFVDLKPRKERTQTSDQIVAELRPKFARVTGVRTFLSSPQPVNLSGTNGPGRTAYQFTLTGTNTEDLYHYAPILEDKIKRLPGFEDVGSDLQIKSPQIQVAMDRDKIATLGLTVNQVETALSNAYSSRQVSQILAANNQYQVVLGVAPEFQANPAALSMLYVRSSGGRLIPLDTVAKVTTNVGPLTVAHSGQLPSVTVNFNLKPGVALGDAVAAIQDTAAATLPSTVTATFVGAAQAFQESLRGLGLILVMAIVVIYIVLGVLYESFTHPLTILSGLPAAGFGALLTLLIFKSELGLYAFVGMIMLIGLVKKNGIMMVDFAVASQRERGLSPRDAIHEACMVRFRPIMMTSMAALAGTMPVALGYGAGAESRRPLGLAVVGGLVVSQMLTLFITPVYYLYIENARIWLAGRSARRRTVEGQAEGRRLGVETRGPAPVLEGSEDPA